MTVVQVGELTIGDGVPKICVSLAGATRQEVLEKGRLLANSVADVIEWRLDYLSASLKLAELVAIAEELSQLVRPKPLLVTFRTLREGGQRELALDDYLALYSRLLDVSGIALIDLEFFLGVAELTPIIIKAQEKNIKVILSNHDFEKTPSKSQMKQRLLGMSAAGADICKLAAMPQSPLDVLNLMVITEELSCGGMGKPIVTMSMGELGKISRVAGKLTGSALTFGALTAASAPGQLALTDLAEIMKQF